ncbi:hypothetical protein CRE_07099 [Caenorhabditis remanei]|uniref:Uncharacterized protein n=1 Tax=Caenorhabditis remanei TaxID=31234 RepID=E3NMD2_CAERE|nr:hypothetical protein CRE_07099 [Caenorhabditis remanei]
MIGPLAFGRKDGDDAKAHVPFLGQFGVGDVNQMTAKFTPEGMRGQKANGGTFDIDDEKGPQLGYMDRETTMGERSGSTGKEVLVIKKHNFEGKLPEISKKNLVAEKIVGSIGKEWSFFKFFPDLANYTHL